MKAKKLLAAASLLLIGAGCAPSQTATPTPTPTASNGPYKDGTYTGKLADVIFGPIQVQAVVSGSKLADVKFLQYPNKPGNTTDISDKTMPVMKQEAIVAQSAEVDNISGATQTVDGFKVTLADALSQAK